MIVVIGAGIAGLASAIALAPFGEVLVLERRTEDADNAGAGIQLSPNAVKAIDAISHPLSAEILAEATEPDGLMIRTAGTRKPMVTVPYGEPMMKRFKAPYVTMARGTLHTVLLEYALTQPNIQVVYNLPIHGVVGQRGGWNVPEIDMDARFVVAADGVNSAIRSSLYNDEPLDEGWIAWRGFGAVPSRHTQLILAPEVHLVRYAMADDADNVVLIANEHSRSPQVIAGGPLGGDMADIEAWVPWKIKVQPKHRFGDDRLAFVGDAAHAMLPFLAQGAAMALEDAAVLGHCVARHGLTDKAVARYGTERQDRTMRLAKSTVTQGKINHMAPPLSLVRNAAIRTAGAGGVLDRVKWVYGWMPPTD